MTTIDEYLETVMPGQKAALQHIRELIIETIPEREEKISYAMPTLTYKGQSLVLMSAFKNHMSLFGAVNLVEDKLEGQFEMSGRGTVKFTEEKLIPDEIIREMIIKRRDEIDAQN